MAEQKQTNRERLREITEGIEQGIKELFESEKYMQYLRTMSQFHTYSRNNVMLINMQMPGATRVAGFNKWRDQFGRHVKKGEKSIKIIAPTPYKKKVEEIKRDPDTKAPLLDKDGKAIIEEKEVSIPMFKVVSVFDVSQTEGKPLPQLASDLTGNVQNYEIFMEALRRSSPVPMEIKPIRKSMDGYFDPENQSITIRDDMSEIQTVSAAIHEITHAKLHNEAAPIPADAPTYEEVEIFDQPALFDNGRIDAATIPDGLFRYELRGSDDDPGSPAAVEMNVVVNHAGTIITTKPLTIPEEGFLPLTEENGLNFLGGEMTMQEFQRNHQKDRQTEEVEAESVSYAVCQYYGIETGENSFGYIANWSSGKELPELKASLDTIQRTASGLISDIDRNFMEICKERGIDLTAQKEASPAADSIEQFVSDFCDYMDQLYQAGVMQRPHSLDSREQTIADIAHELHHGNFLDMRDYISYASGLSGAPSAEALLNRLDKLEYAREAELSYRVHDNPQAVNGQEASYIQAYEKSTNGEPVPREIIFAGSREQCDKILEQLNAGRIGYKDVWALGDLPLPEPGQTEPAQENMRKSYLAHANPRATGEHDRYYIQAYDSTPGGSIGAEIVGYGTKELCIEVAEQLNSGAISQNEALQWLEGNQMQDTFAQTDESPVQQEEVSTDAETPPAPMLPDAPEQALDEYPMPDEALNVADLEAYGYLDGDMLPLSKEQAMELFDKELTVYAIVDGGSAEMLFDREDFDTQAPEILFAVSREEWEASPLFHEKIMERHDHQEEREAAFLAHEGDCFAIYQVNRSDPNNVRFMNMDWLQSHDLTVERANYDLVYTGELTADGSTGRTLEALYEQFNLHHPADYHHPSMSVSDIVAVKQNGVVSCHYCDSFGFQEISGFLAPDNPLRNAEMALEDDYGMIDGIINNGPKEPTVAELEQQAQSGQPISLMDLADAVHRERQEKKKSVVEQLKAKPKQEHKKTAPKRSAEREL
ncbi:hypothetical protein ASJ35_06640 [Ruthenibacterium lactatiformans]|uniref:DUF4316 domain-containing protein n=1 Tax=Ruthenibacterium lactatiformans TaxID=1550024 RepID=A0A0W7TS48_9FIRM|nr:LPD28 domain-containing protein [Ruthenibacterium lactatiformans]KUE76684.1 hypothetical protein ASJ35_06640 [Ruthenibacterium lactatiformans]